MSDHRAPALHPLRGDASTIPWPEATRRVAGADTYWLATVGRDASPHVRPLLAVSVEEALYFAASPLSQKSRNLAADSRCSLSTQGEGIDLVVEGRALVVPDAGKLRLVADEYRAKYGWSVEVRDGAFFAEGAPTAGPPPYQVYQMMPERVYGFGHSEEVGFTKWSF